MLPSQSRDVIEYQEAKAAHESWTVRSFQSGDEPQILALFKSVFHIEQSLQCWRWKFCENPEGRQIRVAVTDSERIVGQYAGLPVLMHWNGERLRATDVVDVMVDQDFRAGLKKSGMLMKLGERTACLVDWLVPMASQWPIELLLAHCIELVREAGMMEMQVRFRPDSPHWHLFSDRGFRPEPTPLFFAVGLAVPGIDLDDGCRRWYYTMGDADLV